jgi:hypothetical protein
LSLSVAIPALPECEDNLMAASLQHSLPRRLRILVPAIRRDPRAAARLRAGMRGLPGVERAWANPLTGSLVLEHDGGLGRQREILECLTALGHPVCPSTATGLPHQAADRLAEILAQKLAEHCLEQMMRLIFARLA